MGSFGMSAHNQLSFEDRSLLEKRIFKSKFLRKQDF